MHAQKHIRQRPNTQHASTGLRSAATAYAQLTRPPAPSTPRTQLHRLRKPVAAVAAAAGSSAARAASSEASRTARLAIAIRPAVPVEYWPAADLHCKVYGDGPTPEHWKSLLARVDRITSLRINDHLAESGSGRNALLLAYEGAAPSAEEAADVVLQARQRGGGLAPTEEVSPMGLFHAWVHSSVDPPARPGIGVAAESVGLVGVAAVDSFCDLVPARVLDWQRDGVVGCMRRSGIAYISNVAVLPSARRQGVARQLMAVAESLAAEWGCRAAGLHCNPKKDDAEALYRSLGYRRTVLEPSFMPYLQGRAPDRCYFHLKRLPPSTPEAVAGGQGKAVPA